MVRSPHPLLRSIGLAIRSLRRERHMSQESIAALSDIDRSYMSSIERGLRNLSVLNLARIAEALDVPVWELLYPQQRRTPVTSRPGPDDTAIATPVEPSAGERSGPDWEPRYLSLG